MIFGSAALPGYSYLSRHGSFVPSDVRVGGSTIPKTVAKPFHLLSLGAKLWLRKQGGRGGTERENSLHVRLKSSAISAGKTSP